MTTPISATTTSRATTPGASRAAASLRGHLAPARRRWQVPDQGSMAYVQGALALTYPVPGGADLELVTEVRSILDDDPPDPPRADEIPDAHQWATRFVQAVIEVVGCDRPLSQLARWTVTSVYDDLAERRDRVAQHRKGQQVRAIRQHVASVHVWRPSLVSAEVAARVCVGNRSRAIAARLDFRRGRWLCTALTFG